MGPKKRNSEASDANYDDIQAELARLRAEVAKVTQLKAEVAELKALTSSNSGFNRLARKVSTSNTTALCEAIPTLLPYLKGHDEIRISL